MKTIEQFFIDQHKLSITEIFQYQSPDDILKTVADYATFCCHIQRNECADQVDDGNDSYNIRNASAPEIKIK